MPLNTQPREKLALDSRGLLDIIKIYRTIQGEGPFAGQRSVFVRLAGCNLDCPSCDTDYTTNRRLTNPGLVAKACSEAGPKWLVVITGGEPFRQNILPLIKLLLLSEHAIQVETNGVYCPPDEPKFPWGRVHIVCSPKTESIHPKLVPDYFKYVMDADHVDPDDGLPTSVLGREVRPARPTMQNIPIYLQPADDKDEEQNSKNLDACVKSCFKFGYILTLQTHKLIGLE